MTHGRGAHRCAPTSTTGGRRVTLRRAGRDEILGLAHSDHGLVVFLVLPVEREEEVFKHYERPYERGTGRRLARR